MTGPQGHVYSHSELRRVLGRNTAGHLRLTSARRHGDGHAGGHSASSAGLFVCFRSGVSGCNLLTIKFSLPSVVLWVLTKHTVT